MCTMTKTVCPRYDQRSWQSVFDRATNLWNLIIDRNPRQIIVMGLGQNFLTWVGSIFCRSGKVSYLWFGFGKFPLKMSGFQFFPFGSKKFPQDRSKSTWV